MPSEISPSDTRTAATMSGDALDDLIDNDMNINDIYRDVDTNMDVSARRKITSGADGVENSLGLGIDEEVKIVKKRKPVAKLDENRLLSQAGIPKLNRIAKKRLRFKGKGHEYSDVARLLSIYQFWLDDLYPKAKFADGLAIIEKLGHAKRIQIMRREWINECKSRNTSDEISKPRAQIPTSERTSSKSQNGLTVAFDTREHLETPIANIENNNDDDLYSATPPRKPQETSGLSRASDINDDPFFLEEENNLDTLLAENFQETPTRSAHDETFLAMERKEEGVEQDFDYGIEAMADMDDI